MRGRIFSFKLRIIIISNIEWNLNPLYHIFNEIVSKIFNPEKNNNHQYNIYRPYLYSGPNAISVSPTNNYSINFKKYISYYIILIILFIFNYDIQWIYQLQYFINIYSFFILTPYYFYIFLFFSWYIFS